MIAMVVVASLLGYLGSEYLFHRDSTLPRYLTLALFACIPVYMIGSLLLRRKVDSILINKETGGLEIVVSRPYGRERLYQYSADELKMKVSIKVDPLKYISRFEKKEIRILSFEGKGVKSKLHTEILGASDVEFNRVIDELRKNYPQHDI